jgi:segregation and condensation protein A
MRSRHAVIIQHVNSLQSTPFEYQVQTNVYVGPLELLLDLIERAELDVTTLSLALVTDQFLDYLQGMSERNADEVSAFLVIAAKLIQLKSAALLPRPSIVETDPDDDPGESLVRQLQEYRKYKQIANLLEERESLGLRTYLRIIPPEISVDQRFDLSGIDLDDLLLAAKEMLSQNDKRLPIDEVVSMSRITIREKIDSILKYFQVNRTVSFLNLLQNNSRIEIVITFLAILELIKQNIIEVVQETQFNDIEINPLDNVVISKDLDLEF